MWIAAHIGLDVTTDDDDTHIRKLVLKRLQYKRERGFLKSHNIIESLHILPTPDTMATMHAVLFGNHRADVMLTIFIYRRNQICSPANHQRVRQHPITQGYRLSRFGTVHALR